MWTTASGLCLMRGRNSMNAFGSGVGLPSGLRAWRCRIEAPASAAPIACSATWSPVIGKYGLMVGVWLEPVKAQVMLTVFWGAALVQFLRALALFAGCQGSS